MQPFQKYNNGCKYILVAIDVFSRYAFAQPIKNKTGNDVLEAFKKMTHEREPRYVQTDKGKEFINKTVQAYLKKKNIMFFTSENDDIKCALAERFNATLQGKMWRYFTHRNTFRFIDVLQDLVYSYNHTIHQALGGISPSEVNAENAERLFYHLYERPRVKDLVQPTYKKGDPVRLLKTKKTFNRGYEPNWSEELFTIDNVSPRGYNVTDTSGEAIKGHFYPAEVQKVRSSPRKQFDIEKILKYRGRGRTREAFVKWKGYSDKFNSWEPVKNIQKKHGIPHDASK